MSSPPIPLQSAPLPTDRPQLPMCSHHVPPLVLPTRTQKGTCGSDDELWRLRGGVTVGRPPRVPAFRDRSPPDLHTRGQTPHSGQTLSSDESGSCQKQC